MSNQISLKRAAIINAISKYATVIVNLLANAILARILTPKDYGVVAIITLFSTFFRYFLIWELEVQLFKIKHLLNRKI